jgi:hypothetical protein
MSSSVKMADIQVGGRIVIDGGFTCQDSKEMEVKADSKGDLYFECDHGKHYLDGQEDEHGNLVGVLSYTPPEVKS